LPITSGERDLRGNFGLAAKLSEFPAAHVNPPHPQPSPSNTTSKHGDYNESSDHSDDVDVPQGQGIHHPGHAPHRHPQCNPCFRKPSQREQIVAAQRTFFNTGATRPISFRKEQMRKLYYLIQDNIDELAAALKADLGKPMQELMAAELGIMMTDVLNVVENVYPHPFTAQFYSFCESKC